MSTYNIVRHNPTHPGEGAERLEEISREEIPDGGTDERIGKESFAGHAVALTHTGVRLLMQRVAERTADEVGGPNHRRGLDKEPPADTADRETDELGGHNHHPLVWKGESMVALREINYAYMRS